MKKREDVKASKELEKAKELNRLIKVKNPKLVKSGKEPSNKKKAPKQDYDIYQSDDDESETTDTRNIRKTKEKIKLIKESIPQPKKEYKDMSISEKLLVKFKNF